jgi:hypothetical protein
VSFSHLRFTYRAEVLVLSVINNSDPCLLAALATPYHQRLHPASRQIRIASGNPTATTTIAHYRFDCAAALRLSFLRMDSDFFCEGDFRRRFGVPPRDMAIASEEWVASFFRRLLGMVISPE